MFFDVCQKIKSIFYHEKNEIKFFKSNIYINFPLILKINFMKKILLIAAFTLLGLNSVVAQNGSFNIGGNIGHPTADADELLATAMSGEVNFLFDVSDKFKVGPSVSYLYYVGKQGVADFTYLPLAGVARYAVSEKFTVGADLGYAFGVFPESNDNSFYYRPMVGYEFMKNVTIQVTYSSMSINSETIANIASGVVYHF